MIPMDTLATFFMAAVLLGLAPGCSPLKINGVDDRVAASNHRSWSPQFDQLPHAEFENGRVQGVRLEDRWERGAASVRAGLVVNAAGPWARLFASC